MEVPEAERVCYSRNILRTNVCQIVENVKNVKNDHMPFYGKYRSVLKS